jgi:hypothetical protein
MAILTRDDAKALIEDIATRHGYVTPEVLNTLNPTQRRVIEKALANKDLMIGASAFT